MINVIDLGVGNIGSLVKMLEYINVEYVLVKNKEDFFNVSGIILPGVGSFKVASDRLFETGVAESIIALVDDGRIPLLGICVGMQLLANYGEEGGGARGLGLIEGDVRLIRPDLPDERVPHMGWNEVSPCDGSLFDGIDEGSDFYFVHSYSMHLNEAIGSAITDYAGGLVAFVQKNNVYGAQFHPEKSQSVGVRFIENFTKLC